MKIGDKVSKGDLILNILNSNQLSTSKVIPKDTENLILEAENALKKTQKQKPLIKKKEEPIIQVIKNGDLESLFTSTGVIAGLVTFLMEVSSPINLFTKT